MTDGIKNIVIVEDEQSAADTLQSFIARYGDEHGETFRVTRYADAVSFIGSYTSADIVFMDIELPSMDGLSVSGVRTAMNMKEMFLSVRFILPLYAG